MGITCYDITALHMSITTICSREILQHPTCVEYWHVFPSLISHLNTLRAIIRSSEPHLKDLLCWHLWCCWMFGLVGVWKCTEKSVMPVRLPLLWIVFYFTAYHLVMCFKCSTLFTLLEDNMQSWLKSSSKSIF